MQDKKARGIHILQLLHSKLLKAGFKTFQHRFFRLLIYDVLEKVIHCFLFKYLVSKLFQVLKILLKFDFKLKKKK